MSGLEITRTGRVAELTLSRNALNTLSSSFVVEMSRALRELTEDESVGALVLASSGEKFFSAGWDLPEVLKLSRDEMCDFLTAFNRLTVQLVMFPAGTVAALGGFAVAGGCILALACDWRVMTSAARRIGLNEVDLGVPLPLPALLLLQDLAGGRVTRDVAISGRLHSPDEALSAGLVDRVVPPERVLDEARELATQLAGKPHGSVAAMKRALRESYLRRLETDGAAHEEAFVAAFLDPRVRSQLEAAAAKLIPRQGT